MAIFPKVSIPISSSSLFSLLQLLHILFSISVNLTLTPPISPQTATPSPKTRTGWCPSPRSSERTTPPSRGPTSGEPLANQEPLQPPPPPTSARRHFRSLTGRKTRSLIECLQRQLELWTLGEMVWEGGGMKTDETKRDRRGATASFQREQKQNKVSAVDCACPSNRYDEQSALLKPPFVLFRLVATPSLPTIFAPPPTSPHHFPQLISNRSRPPLRFKTLDDDEDSLLLSREAVIAKEQSCIQSTTLLVNWGGVKTKCAGTPALGGLPPSRCL